MVERALSLGAKPRFGIQLCPFLAVGPWPFCAPACSSVKWGQGWAPYQRFAERINACLEGLHGSKYLHISSPAWGGYTGGNRHLFPNHGNRTVIFVVPTLSPAWPADTTSPPTCAPSSGEGRLVPSSRCCLMKEKLESFPPCFIPNKSP